MCEEVDVPDLPVLCLQCGGLRTGNTVTLAVIQQECATRDVPGPAL